MEGQIIQAKKENHWLMGRIDVLHGVLCPGQTGTWRQRVRQVVRAVRVARKTVGMKPAEGGPGFEREGRVAAPRQNGSRSD